MLNPTTGVTPEETKRVVRELQGIRLSAVVGAAAGTKMNVPGMGPDDTVVSVTDYPSTIPDDAANVSMAAAKAAGTLTVAAAVDGDVCVVNDVTYTFKNAPTLPTHVKVTAGNNNAMATALAATINAYENRRLSTGNPNTPVVSAAANAAVVTVTALAPGTGSGPVVVEAGSEITLVATNPGAILATCAVAIDNVTTITVNGITFSAKATIVDPDLHFKIKTDGVTQAAEIARVINAYRVEYGTLDAVATAGGAVVTITPGTPKTGNAVTLTGTPVRLAASGAGYLTGGSSTGGFTSLTNLTGKSVLVLWMKKNP